ncbi:MAG: chromosome segregation protein SMC [Gammaproteobacteria bacterium]
MRLSNIKLSGFKSFVDPTTLTIPGNLVGIVGPNGCGKSNILDAVMWVMGESSAKHLRGDSLTDVIFNGSSVRKPVGQASVELCFDNTENKLGGQYASYNEISIKRQINRDSISTYFLNGSRCRRRDITAIFLGTGLGPRSYAIIEQGMISRLIEAKPEELRTFIEEAAGISKYRERRRETENRIKHTKENISRLSDIREELDNQLKHLQRQARAAKRYQGLKQEERKLNAELLTLNWRDLNKQAAQKEEEVRKQENTVEAGVAELRQIEAHIEVQREVLSSANTHFNQVQSGFYQVGSDISQLEQKIQHVQERMAAIELDLEKARQVTAETHRQQEQDHKELDTLVSKANSLEPELQGKRSQSDKAYELLNQAEQAMQSWQTEWDAYNASAAEFSQQEQIDQTRLEHLELGLEDINHRRGMLQVELSGLEQVALQGQIDETRLRLNEEIANQAKLNGQIESEQQALRLLRIRVREQGTRLDGARSSHQKSQGRLASLEALQQSALGEHQDEVKDWLEDANLINAPRLAQKIQVEPEWTQALETVMGAHLQYICVDKLASVLDSVGKVQGCLGIISDQPGEYPPAQQPRLRLLDKVNADISIQSLLGGIYLAEDLHEAMALHDELDENESVVTRDGVWIGSNWIYVNKGNNEQSGMLGREQEISEIHSGLQRSTQNLTELEQQLTDSHQAVEQSEQRLDEYQQQSRSQQTKIADYRSMLAAKETQIIQMQARSQQILDEIAMLDEEEEGDNKEVDVIRSRLSRIESDKGRIQSLRAELIELREQHKSSLDEARRRWQGTHEESHGIALQLEAISSKRASLEQAIKRNEIQSSHLQGRCNELNKELDENKAPLSEMQQLLENKLKEKVDAEKKLADARTNVQNIENKQRQHESERTHCEQKLQELRAELEQARMAMRECQVRLQTLEEQLAASDSKLEEILATLDEDADQATWSESLDAVTRKIQRLGPINLAAIDEFSQLSERKTYLDSQHEDLSAALSTLENAIKKLDRETRTRFKETFDDLNINLKEMFPKLFGGGHAYLEMVGDDLLNTGVAVMARPPGKRNSNIHLLSGGEKALTAVALVFAIFKLNPAPFCILDEVDAPLDDTNVGRFCELVSSMSEEVQFIFVTHNKITMEISHQLLGVTMQEAGVSRLVSVDMDEAVQMAAIA